MSKTIIKSLIATPLVAGILYGIVYFIFLIFNYPASLGNIFKDQYFILGLIGLSIVISLNIFGLKDLMDRLDGKNK